MANHETVSATDAVRILVVEDNAHIAFLVKFILEREGYRVVHAADGRAAETEINAEPVALVVLDVMLPFFDGFELLAKIRARPEWAGVPVIMLTARSQESDIVRALDAGASDYMVKPFQP
ncbi:MAG: response regulator, partial [Betaproteobacteria bacterium]|nr:response regulator [Betaproteobacteria bacterium]